MKLCSRAHHSAEALKITARKELMRREVARQPPVNLLVTQLLGMLIQPQRFSFDSAYLILQYLVGTKLDALQLNLGGFTFGRSGHRLRARQYGMKIADTVQMHLPPLGKVFPHDVRQSIQYRRDISLRQRAAFLNSATQFVGSGRAVQADAWMKYLFFPLFVFWFRKFIPIK